MSHIILFIFPNEAHLDHDGSKVMGKIIGKINGKIIGKIIGKHQKPIFTTTPSINFFEV
jgi:hypothetical protein